MARDITALLTTMLEASAPEHGLELVMVEVVGQAGNPVVRIYLDREGGINIDDIAEANAWISEEIDAAGELTGPYTLEVSSPGIERPLRKATDYERFAGRTAVVKLTAPVDKRGTYTGVLVGLEGDSVLIDVDEERMRVPLSSIRKAHLKFDFASIDEGKTQ
ncbi:MAG: ribosome maturation factor RimP [Coriobacteriia bacterium]